MFPLSRRPSRPILYALAGLVVLFELVIAWLVLHPDVNAAYRAFYIDKSSTCLPQPVSGNYRLGTTVSFRDPARNLAQPLKPCGWFVPNGDHTPTKGTSSLLRFAIPLDPGPLSLRLELDAVTSDTLRSQRLVVSVGGVPSGELQIEAGPNHFVHVPIPAELTFARVQRAWAREYGNPLVYLWDGLTRFPDPGSADWLTVPQWLALAALVGLALGVVLLVRRQWPEAVFALLAIIIPLCAGLASMIRFVAGLAPASLVLCDLLGRNRAVFWASLLAFFVLCVFLTRLWVLEFVPLI